MPSKKQSGLYNLRYILYKLGTIMLYVPIGGNDPDWEMFCFLDFVDTIYEALLFHRLGTGNFLNIYTNLADVPNIYKNTVDISLTKHNYK